MELPPLPNYPASDKKTEDPVFQLSFCLWTDLLLNLRMVRACVVGERTHILVHACKQFFRELYCFGVSSAVSPHKDSHALLQL